MSVLSLQSSSDKPKYNSTAAQVVEPMSLPGLQVMDERLLYRAQVAPELLENVTPARMMATSKLCRWNPPFS